MVADGNNSCFLSFILSSDGEFVQIIAEGEQYTHLTRYVTQKYSEQVKKLVAFRNTHVAKPFLCERFHGIDGDFHISKRFRDDDVDISWDGSSIDDVSDVLSVGEHSQSTITLDKDEDSNQINVQKLQSQVIVRECSFGRRVEVVTPALYSSDTDLDHLGSYSTSSTSKDITSSANKSQDYALSKDTVLSCQLILRFPIAFCPSNYLSILHNQQQGYAHNGICKSTIPQCHAKSNYNRKTDSQGNSSTMVDLFFEVNSEMTLLYNDSYYPSINPKRVVVVEQIDDIDVVFNGPVPTITVSGHGDASSTTDYSCRAISKTDLNKENIQVEAWLSNNFLINLNGDYVTLYSSKTNNDDGKCKKESLHISLLDFSIDPIVSKDENFDPESLSVLDRIKYYQNVIVKLVGYRDYLESGRSNLSKMNIRGYAPMLEFNRYGINDAVMSAPIGDNISLDVTGAKYTALTRKFYNTDVEGDIAIIVTLKGLFEDRTIMEIDLRNEVVMTISPNAEVLKFTLSNCLIAPDSMASDALAEKLVSDQDKLNGPPPYVVRHTRSLLSFYRWARTPVSLRGSLIKNDNNVSTIAQAAAMESHRHLLIWKMSKGEIDQRHAQKSSNGLQNSLNYAGRDLLKKYVPYVGLIESIEKEYSDHDENSIHLYTEDDPLRKSSRSTRLYEKVTHPALHRQMLRQRAKKLQQQNKEFLVACERLKAKDI